MEFQKVLEDVGILLSEMSVAGLVQALSKDSSTVDSVVLPKLLRNIETGGYASGLRDGEGNEVDAGTAYEQVCRELSRKRISVAQTGMLVKIVNRLASGNKVKNSPVRLPDQPRQTWSPIQRRVSGLLGA